MLAFMPKSGFTNPNTSQNYDVLGRRVSSGPDGVGAQNNQTRFLWSGDHVVLDCSSDNIRTPLWSYSWGVGVDNLLACTLNPVPLPHLETPPAPQAFFPISDRLGSIMGLVDATGAVVARYDYDAWGNPFGTWTSPTLPYDTAASLADFRYRWQCREYHPVYHDASLRTGIYYFRNRWYDPVSGRFLSKDPITINGGTITVDSYLSQPVDKCSYIRIISYNLHNFRITRFAVDATGEPVFDWHPNFPEIYDYFIIGKTSLTDKDWHPHPETPGLRFF